MQKVLIFSKVHKNKTNFKIADTPNSLLIERNNHSGVAEPPMIFYVLAYGTFTYIAQYEPSNCRNFNSLEICLRNVLNFFHICLPLPSSHSFVPLIYLLPLPSVVFTLSAIPFTKWLIQTRTMDILRLILIVAAEEDEDGREFSRYLIS